ncbi:hypothetical protein ASPWEDRAFT_26330 [Aspergillus wentii DTO 134E9]|uniref:Major facilitator superfamily (MFS) profile domain-containing protein n=1 Tax=Aspergillus wentii DTO 134E9 TaxID=1073089 RepID=A0A1L9RPV8_ASPWE|nr:uncharacterized protein ASPWEDRAFT_26330 [Aspergillus wentii DTO 134E9]OJJ36893.1 hypothetical protein ASPWEDRAFT_26330 [Aspergillus wentii DTO 134E9]
MDYVLHVFLSDTTDLVNRAFVYDIAGTPYIATTFAGRAAAQKLYRAGNLWWRFGTFTIVTPVVAAPILILFWVIQQKACKEGLVQKRNSRRTWSSRSSITLLNLTVVFGVSMQDAGYITNISSIESCFWSVPLGPNLIADSSAKVGRLKWTAMPGMPLILLGSGLMIHFHYPHSPIGYVVMCEIFKAFGGDTLVICHEMAAMAAGSHETIAVAFVLVGLSSKIGGSVGTAISGAIWSNTVPEYLEKYLPADKKGKAIELYGVHGDGAAVSNGDGGARDDDACVWGGVTANADCRGVCVCPLQFWGLRCGRIFG